MPTPAPLAPDQRRAVRAARRRPAPEPAHDDVGASLSHAPALLAQVSSSRTTTRLLRSYQSVVGNVATRGLLQRALIQRWVAHNGKFFMGLKPNKALNGGDKGWLDAMETWTAYVDPKKNTVYGPPGHASYEEMMSAVKASQPVVPKVVPTLPAINTPTNDYVTVFLVDPAELFYSQDSIGEYFSDGGKISDLANNLKSGKINSGTIEPIRLVVKGRSGGQIAVTVDNRRLWAFKKAKVQIRARWASPTEAKGSDFKFTAYGGASKSIQVRTQG